MARKTFMLFLFLGVVVFSDAVYGWLRPHYDDAVVVERSELIVVGRLKEGSVKYGPLDKDSKLTRPWVHYGTLIITEVLKGKCDSKEIPVIIHNGLTPVVGGYWKQPGGMINLRGGRKDYPKDIIQILDRGSSAMSFMPLVKDARENNLWFLRKRIGHYRPKPGTGKFGIVDPEDLHALQWKDYFKAYLEEDPEAAVRKWVEANPEKSKRTVRYLDHLAVQKILKIEDPQQRLEKLLPYYIRGSRWKMKPEARDGLIALGELAGRRLEKVFEDSTNAVFRTNIIRIWRDVKYDGAVPILIEMLKKHDQFWESLNLKDRKWALNSDPRGVLRHRMGIHSEVSCGVAVLRTLNSPAAKEVLIMTRDRWKTKWFNSKQIVEQCEAALKQLSETKQP